MTIHKLLGVKPGSSDERRTLTKEGESSNQDYRVIVIDECSMIGTEMFDYITENTINQIVVFIGDSKQLPPVKDGKGMSKTFNVKTKASLTTVMRQRNESPIVALTSDIRDMIDVGRIDMSSFKAAIGSDGTGIFKAGDNDLPEWLTSAFTSEEFKNDNDSFRYLAWRNVTVDSVNKFVRSVVYGKDAERFVVGERLMFRKPVMKLVVDEVRGWKRKTSVFQTDEEAIVRSISKVDHFGVPSWELMMSGDDHEDESIFREAVYIVHEDGVKKHATVLGELKKKGREFEAMTKMEKDKAKYNPNWKGNPWPEFYDFLEAFADVQPVYAMTIHRSQGSTFDSVFLDMADITMNRDIIDMLKMLYVGASRPRRYLIV